METVTVIPLTGLDQSLSYKVPEALEGKLRPGFLVRIPLGSRSILGIVESQEADPTVPAVRLKYIQHQAHDFPVVCPSLIPLARWISTYYGCGLDSVFETILPAVLRKGVRPKEERYLSLSNKLPEDEVDKLRKRAPKQFRLYQVFAQQMHPLPIARNSLLRKLNLSASVADSMVEKEILTESRKTLRRDAYADELGDAEQVKQELAFDLNPSQKAAIEDMEASLETGKFRTHLLHGVTGSGKTEVYLSVLKRVLQEGGGAIFLVPEVALTPQTLGRLRARLEQESGAEAVVWHSMLSDGERFDAWKALSTGEIRLVVGARSAIFAPIPNLKLIIVDEEHEPAYKQDETPRYHGRDVAVYRAFQEQALCILGSATPALETLSNARNGKYRLNQLPERVDDRQLPLVHVVDMCREGRGGKGPSIFSRLLTEKMRRCFENGEQCILFINRRGFDSSLQCTDCGYVAECEHCDISLTHHRADNILRCHLCGHEEYVPKFCPECKSPSIRYRGSGTQKVEHFAQKILPHANIVRIDADTMGKKHLFRTILNDFRSGKINVLVGTQMIAKGLDFPNVTLVGLMDADISMHLPDFRASERTFQLLVQVAGRSGRGNRAGEVVVQTYLPHAEAIQFGRRQDFDGFAEEEMANRKEFGYPPFRHLIHHLFRSRNREKVEFYADQWTKHLEKSLGGNSRIEIRGPAPCPVERIQDFYRYQVWYFVPQVTPFVKHLTQLRKAFRWDREVIEVVDVDAVHLV